MANQDQSFRQVIANIREDLRHLREWLFARRVCSEALAAYAKVRRVQPTLRGDALYEAVIVRRTRVDAEAARRLLEQAHASREDWDNDRPTRFRDVVMFMIVTEYLGRSGGVGGMRMDLSAYLDRRLPEYL